VLCTCPGIALVTVINQRDIAANVESAGAPMLSENRPGFILRMSKQLQ